MAPPAYASHDEVWDDSLLMDNWNEALAEYKKYHSIAARGEKVSLEQLESSNDGETPAISGASALANSAPIATDTGGVSHQNVGAEARSARPSNPDAPLQQARSGSNGMHMPQNLLGNTADEGMKNLMMSWYYAGYYTGLYEGQQKAWAEMQERS